MNTPFLVLKLGVCNSQSLSLPSTQYYTVLSIFKDRNHQVQLNKKICGLFASQISMFPLVAKLKEYLITAWFQPLFYHHNKSLAE